MFLKHESPQYIVVRLGPMPRFTSLIPSSWVSVLHFPLKVGLSTNDMRLVWYMVVSDSEGSMCNIIFASEQLCLVAR